MARSFRPADGDRETRLFSEVRVKPWEDQVRERTAQAPESTEVRIERLERQVAQLQSEVRGLTVRRNLDEPAIDHARWERRRREIGNAVALIALVLFALFWLLRSGR